MKVGNIAWGKDSLERKSFPILTGQGIFYWFISFHVTVPCSMIIFVKQKCLRVILFFFILLFFIEVTPILPLSFFFSLSFWISTLPLFSWSFKNLYSYPHNTWNSSITMIATLIFRIIREFLLILKTVLLYVCRRTLRPFPISSRRTVPAHIDLPDWAIDVSCLIPFLLMSTMDLYVCEDYEHWPFALVMCSFVYGHVFLMLFLVFLSYISFTSLLQGVPKIEPNSDLQHVAEVNTNLKSFLILFQLDVCFGLSWVLLFQCLADIFFLFSVSFLICWYSTDCGWRLKLQS